jgi:hypothetical protein
MPQNAHDEKDRLAEVAVACTSGRIVATARFGISRTFRGGHMRCRTE